MVLSMLLWNLKKRVKIATKKRAVLNMKKGTIITITTIINLHTDKAILVRVFSYFSPICHFAHKSCTKNEVFIYLKYQKRNTRMSFQKDAKKLKKVVDICLAFCYYIRAPRTEAKR